MSVCWTDFDQDGAEDIYVADMWTAAGERISSQEIFKKDAPGCPALYRKHAMGNSLFRNSGAAFEDRTAAAGSEWDVGHGRATRSISIMTDFRSLHANGMVFWSSREDLNSFFWRQVRCQLPDQPKPCTITEQGWSAINELIRADGTMERLRAKCFLREHRDGTFSDVSGAVAWTLSRTEGRCSGRFRSGWPAGNLPEKRNAPQFKIVEKCDGGSAPVIAFRLRGVKSIVTPFGAAITLEQNQAGKPACSGRVGISIAAQQGSLLWFGRSERLSASFDPLPSGLVQEVRDLPPNHRIG